jgi:hypothetical protein
MNEQVFRKEFRRCEMLEQTAASPEDAAYQQGYKRGLRRSYHGENFGTEADHKKWCTLVKSQNPIRRRQGEGYRAALQWAETSSKKGRPAVGDVKLYELKVTADLLQALEEKAARLNMTLPNARREAYKLWVVS